MEEEIDINNEDSHFNENYKPSPEMPRKKRGWFKAGYVKIIILLFAVATIFYSFLGWKMTRTSNPFVANPKFIFKSIFTRNPAELASNVFNKWDTLYLRDKKIMPAENFLDLKKLLESALENNIYFAGLSNTIAIDGGGNSIFNKGTFFTEKNNKFTAYNYYIYKYDTSAKKSSELDRKAGLTIHKQPQSVSANTFKEHKSFSTAALKAFGNINFNDLKTKDTERIYISRFMEINIIQTSNSGSKPLKTIRFDNNGNIIDEQKKIDELYGGWSTYRMDNLGFEFMYSPEMKVNNISKTNDLEFKWSTGVMLELL